MARRRLNTRFLVISLAVAGVGGAGALFAFKFVTRARPQQFVNAARIAEQQQQWDVAAANLGRASGMMPRDAGLRVELGQAYENLAAKDPAYHAAAVASWTQATEIDPSNLQARQLLLNAAERDLSVAEAQPKNDRMVALLGQRFQTVADDAQQLAAVDPNDQRLRWVQPSLVIRRWLREIPIPLTPAESAMPAEQRPTDLQKVDAAVAQLSQVLHDDPTSPAGLWIARAKVHEAQLALADGRPATAGALFQSAATVYDDALAHDPAHAATIYASKAQVLSVLLQTDPRPEQRAQYQAGEETALDHAQAAADPKDLANYDNIKMQWAGLLSRRDPAGAEKVYQDVIARNPPIEMAPRLLLATMLSHLPNRDNDALAVLDQLPTAAPVDLTPARQEYFAAQVTRGKLLRAQILFNQLTLSKSPEQRTALATKVQSLLDELQQNQATSTGVDFLKLKGLFQFAQGAPRDAALTLTAAVQRLQSQPGARDPDLLLHLAQVYTVTGQSAAAAAVLEPAMSDPAMAAAYQPHQLLAQIYLSQHDTAHLQPQLDWLKQNRPNDPEAILLQISALDPATDKDAIADLYARLPESTPADMANKARVASRDGNTAEAVRLRRAVYDKNPADSAAARELAQAYAADKQPDAAKQVLADALQRNPNDSSLVLASQVLNGTTVAALAKTEAQQAQKNDADPFTREVGLADAARLGSDAAGELQHLKAALALKPDDRNVLSRLFTRDLEAHDFTAAHGLLAAVTSSNADEYHGDMDTFRLDLAKNDQPTALTDAQKLVSTYPEFASSWDALAAALQTGGRYADAIANFQQALSKQAGDQIALRGLIECSLHLGKNDDARHYITLARAQYPDSSTYREMQVNAEIQFGSPDSLVPSLAQAMATHPEVADNYRWESACLLRSAELNTQRGLADDATADLQKARDVLQQATTRWPDDLNFAATLADAQLLSGDLPAGVQTLQATAGRPAWKDKPQPQVALANLYQQAGQPQQAVAPLRMALIQSDDAPDVEVRLASLLGSLGQSDQALSVLNAHRDVPNVLAARIDALMNLHRAADAESELAAVRQQTDAAAKAGKIPSTGPVDEVLQNLLLSVYYREGKYEPARGLAAQAIAVDPNNLGAQFYAGVLALKPPVVDPAAAIAHLSIVRDRRPGDVEARTALAEADLLRNDRDGAVKELAAAVAAVPGDKAARLKLADLYNTATPPQLLQAEQTLDQGLAQPQLKTDPDLLRAKAVVLARSGQGDEAVSTIRAAMAQVPDKSTMVRDYLNVLLLTKNDALLLQESDPLVADASRAPWWAYDLRARAKNQSGDRDGAVSEFDTALTAAAAADRAADPSNTTGGLRQSAAVAGDASTELGVDGALALVLPRAQNDTNWKLIALTLEQHKGDHAAALHMAESAIATIGTLPPAQQDELLSAAGSLYLTSNPPQGDQAASVYQQLLARRPKDVAAMNNLACVLVDDVSPPRPQDALKYSQQAYDQVQQTGQVVPTVYDTQGWVLILDGRVDDGINVLQKVGSDAQLPDVHYHLAQGFMRKQLPEGARRELQQAGDMLDQAAAAGHRVDPSLRAKVDAAMKQVQKMIDAKAQATP